LCKLVLIIPGSSSGALALLRLVRFGCTLEFLRGLIRCLICPLRCSPPFAQASGESDFESLRQFSGKKRGRPDVAGELLSFGDVRSSKKQHVDHDEAPSVSAPAGANFVPDDFDGRPPLTPSPLVPQQGHPDELSAPQSVQTPDGHDGLLNASGAFSRTGTCPVESTPSIL